MNDTKALLNQRAAEEASHIEEHHYRTFIEHLPIGLFRATLDGRLLDANPALFRMLGYRSLEEIAARNLQESDFGPQYDHAALMQRLEREDAIIGWEAPWKHRDGSIVYMRENVRLVRAAEGATPFYEGSVENVTDRILMEQESRKLLDRTELALWGADLAAWDWHVPTGTLVFSQRAAEIMDCAARDLPLHIKAFQDLIHPDDRPSVVQCMKAHLKGATSFYECVYRLLTKQNIWRWVLARGKVVSRARDGKADRLTGTLLDITDRKAAEQALEEHQDLLRAVIDGTDDSIFVKDRAGRYVMVNQADAVTLGLMPQNMIGLTDADLYPPEIVEEINVRDQAVLCEGINQIYEQAFPRLDGSTRTYLIAKYPQRTSNGDVIGVIGIARDITERKRAEETLRLAHDELEERVHQRTAQLADAVTRLQQEIVERRQAVRQLGQRTKQLQSLADHSPDLILRINSDWKYVFVNESVSAFIGRPREKLLGRRLHELDLPDSVHAFWEGPCHEVFHTARPRESEYVQQTKEGSRYYQVWAVPEFDATGRVDTVLATARDITEFKQAQEQLRHTERLASIGTLAAGIAHEINNPTGGILMAAQAALDDFEDHTFVQRCLQEIIEDAKRCSKIVKSVLRFSRQQPTEKEPHDFNDLVRHAADMAQELVRLHGGRLELDLDPSLQEVNINPTELEQVILNLIRNALEAGQAGACVKVRTRKLEDGMCLSVCDNGPGMPMEQLGRIFDPFYTTRGKEGGTGLGLSIVHGIIHAHGGRIDVESRPSQGTIFNIELPC